MIFQDGFAVWPAIVTSNFTTAKMDKDWVATHALPGVQVNLFKNPNISNNLNFPPKNECIFCHLNRKCAMKGLAVLEFFSELSLSIKKLTPKKMAGNLNCLEYWYSYLSKKNLFLKIIYLYSPFL